MHAKVTDLIEKVTLCIQVYNDINGKIEEIMLSDEWRFISAGSNKVKASTTDWLFLSNALAVLKESVDNSMKLVSEPYEEAVKSHMNAFESLHSEIKIYTMDAIQHLNGHLHEANALDETQEESDFRRTIVIQYSKQEELARIWAECMKRIYPKIDENLRQGYAVGANSFKGQASGVQTILNDSVPVATNEMMELHHKVEVLESKFGDHERSLSLFNTTAKIYSDELGSHLSEFDNIEDKLDAVSSSHPFY